MTTWIISIKLISIYRMMKKNPKKVWVSTEFHSSPHNNRRYLEVLRKLGLTERVPVVYYCGVKHLTRREVKGYRIRR